jgi:hypothetical protein
MELQRRGLIMQMTSEISNIVPDIIKPFVDLVWFTQQVWMLIGLRNTAMLYAYLGAGLGFLHVVTPSFDSLVMKRNRLEGQLRYVGHCSTPAHIQSRARAPAHTRGVGCLFWRRPLRASHRP